MPKIEIRKDTKGRVLQKGEGQDANGTYYYKYTNTVTGTRPTIRSKYLTLSDVPLHEKGKVKCLRELEKEIQMQLDKGISTSSGNRDTVIDLVDSYLATHKVYRATTAQSIKSNRNKIAADPFASKKVKSVKKSDAMAFCVHLHEDNGLKLNSIANYVKLLKPAFRLAVEDGAIVRNPFDFKLSDCLQNDQTERKALSTEQVNSLMEFIRDSKRYSYSYDVVYILLNTGLRVSELCGLTFDDVDFERRTISVNHQLQRVNQQAICPAPKSAAGNRLLPMTDEVAAAFRRVIEARPKLATEHVIDGRSGFIFLSQKNIPLSARTVWHRVDAIRRAYTAAGIQPAIDQLSPHILRHTYITTQVLNNVNAKVLQYMAGHASLDMTLQTYTHVGYQQAAAEMDRLANAREGA